MRVGHLERILERPEHWGFTMRIFAVVCAAFAALAVVSAGRAAPPANDNRASAQVIEAFPFETHGTLVEATIERLDPQVSECGPIASTLWYRVNAAPDGTISVGMKAAAGVAPVVRVYTSGKSALREVTCGAADTGGTASAAFDTIRGANYFILVGRKPASVDGEFDLTSDLRLPPEPPKNDRMAAAVRLRVPAKVTGTTVGARSEASDPYGCELAGATVWYRLKPPRDGLVVTELHANGKLDAVVGVVSRERSRLQPGSCRKTDRRGNATLAFRGDHSTTYFLVVGQQQGSVAGTFSIGAVAAARPERAPGRALPAHAVRATVDGLLNVNDVWHTSMSPGTTYRIAFTSTGCASFALRRATDEATLVSFSCSGYETFTPGPDASGRYVLEVRAAQTTRAQPYRLQVAAAAPDDIGIGVPLANHTTRHGSLDPRGVDVVDLFHFDVARTSDVKLDLSGAQPATGLRLYSLDGETLASSRTTVRTSLGAGRYVVAVSAKPGSAGGGYRLALLVRDITATTLAAPTAVLHAGAAVMLRPVVTPASSGIVVLQVDRFDTLGGWQFSRLIRIQVGTSVTWIPPTQGKWRVRATYRGSDTASPSRSEYLVLLVT